MFRGPALGLFSSPNPFSQTPDGTLRVADDVRFTAPGVIEPRRGFDFLTGASFGNSASLADALAFYAGDILLAYDLTKVSLYQGSSFTDFSGTFEPVGDNRMRFEGAARSVFFNTSQGLMVWDGVGDSGEPVLAGNPPGLSMSAVNNPDNGWQTPDTAVAYRYTLCTKDAFGRIVEGPPSGRLVVGNWTFSAVPGAITRSGTDVHGTFSNPNAPGNPSFSEGSPDFVTGDVVILSPGEANFPAGAKTTTDVDGTGVDWTEAGAAVSNSVAQTLSITRSVDVTVRLPPDVSELNFVRLYRSFMTAAATDTPSDELFQVFESPFLSSTDVSNGFIEISDTAPEDTLDVPLYTNVNTGDGALAARYRPPISLDIAYWANRMWFANTTNKHSLSLSLIGTGSPDGIQVGDTLSFKRSGVASITLTGISIGTPGDGEFVVYTFGDPGLNIQRTAQGIVDALNQFTSNDFLDAYYASSEGGIPGDMLFVSREFGDENSFQLFSSRETPWNPQLPTEMSPAFTAPASDDNRHPAGLFWSQLGLPEAVPLVNKDVINSDADEIRRIFPLHYRLLIFKSDGIYTSTNVEPFSIQKLSAYVLLAPDSVQVLEDRVYALTDQGIITISDAGVVEISNCIDDVFRALDAPSAIDTVATRAFGLSYRSERQALLWVPEKNDDGTFSDDDEQAFVYSTEADGFTRYAFGVRCGAINPTTNSMVVAPIDDNALWIENKTLTDADYFDLSSVLGVVVAVSGETLTISPAPAAGVVEAGDVVGSSGAYYRVTNVSGAVITTDGATGWTSFPPTQVTLYRAISTRVEFNKFTAGTPADLKMMTQASLLFRQNGIHDVEASFTTEIVTSPSEVPLPLLGWGEFRWGSQPYGSPTLQLRRIEPLPTQVAQCAQLSVAFETRQARAKYEFLGIDVAKKKDAEVNRG